MPLTFLTAALTPLALGHLALILLLGIASWTPPSWCHGLGEALQLYGRGSGADSHYGFYAPDVGPTFRGQFLMCDANGRTWIDSLEQKATGESRVRLASIVEKAFALPGPDASPERQRTLAKTLAALMFRNHPTARRVTLTVDAWVIPSMDEYRTGNRPRWERAYDATFER